MPCALVGRNPNLYGPRGARVLYRIFSKESTRYQRREYLVRLSRACLDDKWVGYASRKGEERRPVECGVPLGVESVPVDRRVRRGTALSAASRCSLDVLRERHSGHDRRVRMA